MKKILKLLIGTNNKGKYKEIKDLLPKYIKTHSVSEFKLKSPREDGSTFEENSIIKSKHFSKKTKLICLADDSGPNLKEIDLIWAYLNFHLNFKRIFKENREIKLDLNRKYLEHISDKIAPENAIALYFSCYLDKKIASVLGKVEGYISTKPKGKNGFGYDPIFIPKNKRKTFGEMSSLQKYKIDHRFAAFKKIRKFL